MTELERIRVIYSMMELGYTPKFTQQRLKEIENNPVLIRAYIDTYRIRRSA